MLLKLKAQKSDFFFGQKYFVKTKAKLVSLIIKNQDETIYTDTFKTKEGYLNNDYDVIGKVCLTFIHIYTL